MSEDFVRRHWKKVDTGRHPIAPGIFGVEFGDVGFLGKVPEEVWADAAVYTQKRLDEIGLAKAGIDVVDSGATQEVYDYIMDILTARIATLKKGMKF
jgi:hypothetical protein